MNETDPDLPWGAAHEQGPAVPELARRLQVLERDHGPLTLLETYERDPAVAVGSDVAVHVALTGAASQRLRHEAASRRWAAAAGVPVPVTELLEDDEGAVTLVSARAPSDPGVDAGYAAAAVAASRALQRAEDPPPPLGRTWSAPRRDRPLRAVRAVLSPLRVREALALKRDLADLPADGWVHGDYRTANVLYDAEHGRVNVIDWDYVGRGWRGSDLLALWAGVHERAVADVLLEAVLADRAPGEAPTVGRLLLWSCVRVLAEQVTAQPLSHRDRVVVRRVRARVALARSICHDLGGTAS